MKLFGSILDDIKKGQFLPVNVDLTRNYADGDSKKSYYKNLKQMPSDWEYRTKKIEYTVNNKKYRTNDFKEVDWQNSIVVFGCSYVFGTGLADTDTITHNLSLLCNRPVINMGSPGSSIKYNFHNNLILKHHYPTPYAVVNVWTGYDRELLYYKKSIHNMGSWSTDLDYAKIILAEEYQLLTDSYFNITTCRNMWGTKYVDCTLFNYNKKICDIDVIHIVDKARDLGHPGSKTSKLVADYIYNKL